jgi:cation:H+ antiporter
MELWTDMATSALVAAFAAAALVIFFVGLRVAGLADRIADRTGLGEALVGAVLLGAATSLSGIIVSVTSALDGRPSLAFANSVGGIAAQTAFLAVADIVYRRSNLEHAAADLGNVFQGAVLMVLLALPLAALTTPETSLWAIHPVSFVIPAVYLIGLVSGRAIREAPMWTPVATDATRADVPEAEDAASRAQSTARILAVFLALMLLMAAAGWVVARTAAVLTDRMALSETLVGALATAIVTSLPELVTTVAAVRHGALQLAVGGIIGGNTFDTLFLTASDVAYREGSLYHAVAISDYAWIVAALLMTGVLVGGLLLRQRQGPAGIGGESVALLGIYAAAIALQVFVMP